MSQLASLVQQLCPDGVAYKSLDEVGMLYGGLSGKSKQDFASGGNVRYASYTNIFSNIATDVSPDTWVRIGEHERQNRVHYGDVLFTGSSETSEEVGMSSSVTLEPPEPLLLNSFCFGFRPVSTEFLDPGFAKHLFRAKSARRQIVKTANGVTRMNISKKRFRSVRIPVPPLPVQKEIAATLDTMNELEAKLEAELKARWTQYSYYRDELLRFSGDASVSWMPLSQAGTFFRGKRFTKADYVDDGIPCIHYGEIYTRYGPWTDKVMSHVRPDLRARLRFARPGDLVIAGVGETVEDVAKAVAWLGVMDVAIHDDCWAFRHSLNPKFVAYYFQTGQFHSGKAKHVARAKVMRISEKGLSKILIPVPGRDEQDRIVAILDTYDLLLNDSSIGLPAEINLRQAQYEYYRDRLLTFDEAVA